jgi:GNAT superfamily N-acetyltransferase
MQACPSHNRLPAPASTYCRNWRAWPQLVLVRQVLAKEKMKVQMIELKEVRTDREFQTAAELFKEYVSQLGVDLSFQNFDQEVKDLSQEYSRPDGILFIAWQNEQTPLGCFGIRKLEDSVCELKRMYVSAQARGLGIGRQLLRKAVAAGRELGYTTMRLDTLPKMAAAMNLYEKEEFYEIAPYRFNPIAGTKYLEVKLK